MKTVYLAGAINGLSYKEATNWRDKASSELTLKGYNVLDPMRGKTALSNKPIIKDSELIYKPEHILRRDLWDIKHSDIIIANLENLMAYPMIGTLMELGYILNSNKKCYLFNVPKEHINHPFFYQYCKKNNLNELLKIL